MDAPASGVEAVQLNVAEPALVAGPVVEVTTGADGAAAACAAVSAMTAQATASAASADR
jgi:hypothetical protein